MLPRMEHKRQLFNYEVLRTAMYVDKSSILIQTEILQQI